VGATVNNRAVRRAAGADPGAVPGAVRRGGAGSGGPVSGGAVFGGAVCGAADPGVTVTKRGFAAAGGNAGRLSEPLQNSVLLPRVTSAGRSGPGRPMRTTRLQRWCCALGQRAR